MKRHKNRTALLIAAFPMLVVIGSLAAIATAPPAIAAPSPTYISSFTDLYVAGSSTGVDYRVGPFKSGASSVAITDIALASTGTLYGISFSALYSIDPRTAALARVGSVSNLNALVVGPDGRLLGATTSGALVVINPATGAASSLGAFGSSFTSSGDLAFMPDGTLYASASVSGTTNDVLVRVNAATGAATRVGTSTSLGSTYMYGLLVSEGQLWGASETHTGCQNGAMFSVDIQTGAGTYTRCLSGANATGAASGPAGLRLAVLGDSYISGEGLARAVTNNGTVPDYECGTNSLIWDLCELGSPRPSSPGPVPSLNNCHRANSSHAYLSANRWVNARVDFLNASCSGAVTANIGAPSPSGFTGTVKWPNSPTNVIGGRLQLQDLVAFHARRSSDVILVTIGGNDAGFGQLLEECLFGDCDKNQDAWLSRILDISTAVESAFRDIRNAAPNAEVYAFGYPIGIDPKSSQCGSLQLTLGLSMGVEERRFIHDRFGPYLNSILASAARRAGVNFVELANVLDGREVCSSSPAINGTWATSNRVEWFHPNPAGHTLIHAAFIAQYGAQLGVRTPPNPNPDSSASYAMLNGVSYRPGSIASLTATVDVDGVYALYSGPSPTEVFVVEGFAPGEVIVLTGYSTPVVLGRVSADSGGRASFPLTFPAGLTPGAHTLVASGRDTNGAPRTAIAGIVLEAAPGDVDADSVLDANDNCPDMLNTNQADVDRDGIGDACDTVQDIAASAIAGYWMVTSDGRLFSFGGAARFNDSLGRSDAGAVLRAQEAFGVAAVDFEPAPSLDGYWILDNSGRVHRFGAAWVGTCSTSLSSTALGRGERAMSLSSTSSGLGYWVFTNQGRVIPCGDAGQYGDVSNLPLNGPVLDSIPTSTGRGYYMVASDGGIFAFGDATFHGSMGGRQLNAPVQSLVPTATNLGYWLVASDGGVFAFGDATFVGSIPGVLRPGQQLNGSITGMVRYGNGYLMVGQDGGIFSFSDKPFLGSLGSSPPDRPIVSVAAQGT